MPTIASYPIMPIVTHRDLSVLQISTKMRLIANGSQKQQPHCCCPSVPIKLTYANQGQSNIIIPAQPRLQPISTNHANLSTSGTIWPHLKSPYHISLHYSQSAPIMPTYANQVQSDLIYSHCTISAYTTANQRQPCQPMPIRYNLTSSFPLSLCHSQSAPTIPTYAHQRQSDHIYSHRTMSAYSTANQHQPRKPYHIRDNLTSSTVTVPCQPMPQSICTNHANLCQSGTIWHNLKSSFPFILDYSQSAY